MKPVAKAGYSTALLHVDSIERSIEFYRKLGFETIDTDRREPLGWARMHCEGGAIMFLRSEHRVDPSKQGIMLYMYAPDLQALHTELARQGVEVNAITHPEYLPSGETFLKDPDGYVVGIAHWSQAEHREWLQRIGRDPRGVGEKRGEYERMLSIAIGEARSGLAEGGIPIGAALFDGDGKLLGRGHNRRVQENDASSHGETDAFRAAGRQRDYRNTVMVTTLAPCLYCSGLILQFGIGTVVVGESRTFQGGIGWLRSHGVEVADLDSKECREMLEGYIAANPAIWNEDIGFTQ